MLDFSPNPIISHISPHFTPYLLAPQNCVSNLTISLSSPQTLPMRLNADLSALEMKQIQIHFENSVKY